MFKEVVSINKEAIAENSGPSEVKRRAIIRIEGIRKVYKLGREHVVALDHIDANIYEGEICCILGTSGSGKSTLLNMLAGLEKPTRGSVYIKGKNISAMSERRLAGFRRKNLGFVFQSYNLLGTLTAVENVALPLTFKGVGSRKRNAAAKKMLELVGLKTHYKHKPSQMSGGQQQRVGIARAFVTNPSVVFADEPTGNLDSKTTVEVMDLMIKLSRDYNETLIIVTHDRKIAEYADRILYLFDGLIMGETLLNDSNRAESDEIINANFEAARMAALNRSTEKKAVEAAADNNTDKTNKKNNTGADNETHS